jgi:uncharacterized protein (TIGR01777 family)
MNAKLKIVIPGGSGQVGTILARHFHNQGHNVVVLARALRLAPWKIVKWDGMNLGDWVSEMESSDIVINLSGRSVNCRYTKANCEEIQKSRIQTTRLVGQAIGRLGHPPRLWMNASTATIYRHAFDRPMDEDTGEFGGTEPGVPLYWRFSIDVAKSWEDSFFTAPTPSTRKIALRSAMVMSPDSGGVFDQLLRLVRLGLGGSAGSGKQFVSWVHDMDFLRSIEFLVAHEEVNGPVNIAAPNPVPNREFMRALRQAWGAPFGLPATKHMLEFGAIVMRTDTELILKSRRVIPGRLLRDGFQFQSPDWPAAARDLVARWRKDTSS